MSETKLLPRPCCCGENTIETLNELSPALKCIDCGLMMTIPASFIGNYKKELHKKWNTRKPMERIVERLEEDSRHWWKMKQIASEQKNDILASRYDAFEIAINGAIEIVKEGGADEP